MAGVLFLVGQPSAFPGGRPFNRSNANGSFLSFAQVYYDVQAIALLDHRLAFVARKIAAGRSGEFSFPSAVYLPKHACPVVPGFPLDGMPKIIAAGADLRGRCQSGPVTQAASVDRRFVLG